MEVEGRFLGLDLDGTQPKLVTTEGIGHNSEALIIGRVKSTIDSLVKLEEEHEEAIQTLAENQEGEREAILLVLGKQLLEGRGTNKGDREFGKWCNTNFPNLSEHVNAKEVTAILWAAEFPEQHKEMLDNHIRVRTTRGLYDKWKEYKKSQDTSSGNGGGSSGNSNTSGSGSNSGVGNSGSGSSDSSGEPDKPPQGDSSTKPNKGKGGINTTDPDTTTAKADATMIASSLIGVVTNVLLFEQTQGRDVEEPELSSAIFNEIRGQSADKMSDAEVEEFIEQKLKRVLSLITKSLPTMGGNVVNIQKAMENYK